MAWPYSAHAFWSKEPNQFDLIDRLPEDVALLSEIDKEQKVLRGGMEKYIWDYSVDYDGHSDRIVSQSVRCKQRGRDLFIKTETVARHRAAAHAVRAGDRPVGAAVAERAGAAAARRAAALGFHRHVRLGGGARRLPGAVGGGFPGRRRDAGGRAAARRRYAARAAQQLVAAWRHFDEAVHHIPVLTTGAYYCGPAFLGPCHPLPVWDPKGTVPDAFKGYLYYLLEHEPSLNDSRTRQQDDLTLTATHQLGGAGCAGRSRVFVGATRPRRDMRSCDR